MPKVEVIIPAYNTAKYLPTAIESVIAQTFEDWRIVLVDDGSTDNTAEVVAPYRERLGDKLLYIYQPNGGLPAARNTAIRNSTGEFLALLDADDIWLPNRLVDTLRVFDERPEVGLSYGFIERVDPNGAVIDTFADRQRNGEGWIAEHIYTKSVDLCCPSVTFRRACVDAVGYFDETMRATEDRDLWLRIAQKFQVAVVPSLIAHYRVSPGSMSANLERMLQSQRRFIEKHYGTAGCGWIARRKALSKVYKLQAEAYAERGEAGRASGDSLRALGYFPLSLDTLRTSVSLLLRRVGLKR